METERGKRTEVEYYRGFDPVPPTGDAYAYALDRHHVAAADKYDTGVFADLLGEAPEVKAQVEATIKAGFKGHIGQTAVLVGDNNVLHILYGVSMPEGQEWRPWDQCVEVLYGRGFAHAVRAARRAGVQHLCSVNGKEGMLGYYGLSANYQFELPTELEAAGADAAKDEESGKPLSKITLLCDEPDMVVSAGYARNLARDWMNLPFNRCSTLRMAELAKDAFIAAGGNPDLVHIHDGAWMQEHGFDLTLSIGRGSNQTTNPPLVMVLEWIGRSDTPDVTDLVVVGKGVVHDKGGLNLKTDSVDMHMDKGGACTVLATMCAIAELKPNVNVRCIVFLVENAISRDCSTTGDIIYSRLLGRRVRIINTDAEGRLGLAESIAYAMEQWPEMEQGVDVATLTGLQAANSPGASTVFGTDEDLAWTFRLDSVDVGDRMTIGCMDYECFKDMQKNGGVGAETGTMGTRKMGSASAGGSVIGAEFVMQAVTAKPWLHIDMAGAMDRREDDGEFSKGADTPNVISLINWVLSQQE